MSIHRAHSENSTYEQMVPYFGRELGLKIFKAPDELQMNTVTQYATKPNPEKPKPTCHQYKNKTTIELNAVISKQKQTKIKATKGCWRQ